MTALEGGAAALALSSGTSAIFYTIINICGSGDEVVSTSTHSQLTDQELKDAGITADMVRLSIGIEDIDDIKNDIDQALNECRDKLRKTISK